MTTGVVSSVDNLSPYKVVPPMVRDRILNCGRKGLDRLLDLVVEFIFPLVTVYSSV